MKKVIQIIVLSFFFLTCKKNPNSENLNNIYSKDSLVVENDSVQGILMLNEFYSKFYFDDNIKIDNEQLKSYLSEKIKFKIDSLRNEENYVLDYDPFIKGQDYNGESIKKTLKIISLDNKNQFRVSFRLFDNKNEQRVNVDYLLEKDDSGKILINSILNDKYLNLTTSNSRKSLSNSENIGDLKIINWIGTYNGTFLRLKDESSDPRGWANFNIKIDKNFQDFYLFSYVEEKKSKLKLINTNNDELIFRMDDNNTIKIKKDKKSKYTLESSYIDSLTGKKNILLLEKK
ncbi:hypothetical protein FLACOL_02417 [Flavobacterium columnare]|uniref:DUF3828 domain-containing protein n=2 Tax=Flavobacterium TaxID=237 RepID=A0A2N9PDI4_9FLAO|nr:DUF3828 domain-containing protein [Flavobacterium columnare]RVU90010.1 DUF3828 domain-containing protein [Flavobacterium columnare]SPE78401.1 hypothetical protein FLACOL_02417 [Flavobacterium columnare]